MITADNADLQQVGTKQFRIGHVDAVHADGACEVPEFSVTRSELIELAKYWESAFLNRAFFIFDTGQIGSTDLRLAPYAERRVNRIVELLGQDAIDAVRDVRQRFALEIGNEAWKKFREYLGPKHARGATVPACGRRQDAHR